MAMFGDFRALNSLKTLYIQDFSRKFQCASRYCVFFFVGEPKAYRKIARKSILIQVNRSARSSIRTFSPRPTPFSHHRSSFG
mmetsp:Transcript_23159/g.57535  ORF Transcript_23159/g.57535 Transcript_23159/m.57535 type:complete len:82 (+) Transcript_23159:239-484(+)